MSIKMAVGGEFFDQIRQAGSYYIDKTELIDIYNYAAALIRDKEARPKNYWANTSGNGIIREFAGRDDFDVTDKFETLMNGGTIVQKISDELAYDSLHENEDNLWSTLLMTGYLTKADPGEARNGWKRTVMTRCVRL